MSKKSDQIGVRLTPEHVAFIEKLERHRITGTELIRGLLDAAAEFYDQNGWLTFPLKVTPEVFQTARTTLETRARGAEAIGEGVKTAMRDAETNNPLRGTSVTRDRASQAPRVKRK